MSQAKKLNMQLRSALCLRTFNFEAPCHIAKACAVRLEGHGEFESPVRVPHCANALVSDQWILVIPLLVAHRA